MIVDVEFVEDTERIKVLLEDTRLNILSLLKVENMSISQISESLEKDRSTIYRHIKKLEERGFVELKGERVVNNVPEMVYGRTAGLFLPCPKAMGPENISKRGPNWDEQGAQKIVDVMDKIGYESTDHEELSKKFTDLFSYMNEEVIQNLKNSEELQDLTYLNLLKVKALIFFLEMEKNPELQERVEELADVFERP